MDTNDKEIANKDFLAELEAMPAKCPGPVLNEAEELALAIKSNDKLAGMVAEGRQHYITLHDQHRYFLFMAVVTAHDGLAKLVTHHYDPTIAEAFVRYAKLELLKPECDVRRLKTLRLML